MCCTIVSPAKIMVNPEGQRITVYRLKGGGYDTGATFHDEVRYEAVEGIVVDLSKVW